MNKTNGNQDPVSGESSHPDPEKIMAYRVGELTAEEDERLWDHLEECDECVDFMLVGMDEPNAEESGVLDFEKELVWSRLKAQRIEDDFEKVRRRRFYDKLAIAATILIVILPLGGFALHQKTVITDLTRPQLNATIHDAVTIDSRNRSRERGNQPSAVELPAGTEFFTIVFPLGSRSGEEVYRVEILDSNERTVWSGEGLEVDQFGFATLGLSRQFLKQGSYEIRILNGEDSTNPVGQYSIQLHYL